ncbi:calcium-binding protein [Atopomonas sediminilitoris]|uniref:calcium-binding protein n=1 Tax=Atopomonas sediminilitoris TaxID=2919919 RepID=UPI002342DB50|nr:calcium-binding protein [Atopomonas sediminilitoris]
MTLPTIEQIVSRYLFDTDVPPSNLKDAALIRPAGVAGTAIQVDMNEFMTAGAGRFVGVERFRYVRNFLGGHDDAYLGAGQKLAAGVYTRDQLLKAYGKSPDDGVLAVSGYYQGVLDSDYAERAYIFGSGEYQINNDALFYVNEDGSREIVDICVEPKNDNFDYEGGGFLAKFTNYLTKDQIDPSGIGRQVPIVFTGAVSQKLALVGEDWYELDVKSSLADAAELANKATLTTSLPYFTGLFAGVIGRLVANDIITYEDPEGRYVIYDGRDVNNNGVIDPTAMLNFTEIDPYKGAAVIAGKGNDTLYGTSYSNDELFGGDGNDQLDGRSGADLMEGGAGDDIYIVDDEDDTVVEGANGGTDLVKSSVTHTLADNVENLELTGSDDINGTGNRLDNEMHGNAGNNLLRGEGGSDLIYGNVGDDTIYGGDGDDNIFAREGNDTIWGDGGLDYIDGGAGNDLITGGVGNDILVGGDGRDMMRGGMDFDTYFADKHDVIEDDNAGRGQVFLGNQVLTGGKRKESDPENEYKGGGNLYVLNGTTLVVNGGLSINQFTNGDLGIHLETEPDDEEKDESPETGDAESRTSPIVLDLDGDGVETMELGSSYFDLDGDGLSERSGWVSPDDGLLVHDLNNDGLVSSGGELFGNHTLLKSGQKAANGFQALAEYDDNGDGKIDAQDASYAALQVWRDLNGNGVSDAGELQSLANAGVVSINTDYDNSTHVDTHGHQHRQVASIMLSNGNASTAADVWFKVDGARRVNSGAIELTPDVVVMANAKGFGKVHDLHQAMVLDAGLKDLLNQFVAADSAAARDALLDNLIYRWAGAADVDPYSRDPKKVYGHVMDARQLVTLENLVGRPYMGTWCWGERDPNPHGQAAPILIAEYLEFKRFTAAQILAQTEYASELDIIRSHFGSDAQRIVVNWDALEGKLDALFEAGQAERIAEVVKVLYDLGTYSPRYRAERDAAFQAIAASDVNLAPFFDYSTKLGTVHSDTLNGINAGTIFYGLEGNDRLYGQVGGDSYHFARGHGDDSILDQGGFDQIVFGHGISQADLEFTRNVTTVWIAVKNIDGSDAGSLRIDNFFDFDGSVTYGAIEKIRFADGSSLDQQQILNILTASSITSGDDLVFGTSQGDSIEALAGNDSVHGLGGNDFLSGGEGNDVLIGDDGNDTLVGGGGDDRLIGGRGSDTYQINAGHGHDVIDNAAESGNKVDRIVFGQDIDRSQVTVSRVNDDLLVKTSATSSLKLTNYFQGDAASGTAVDQMEFEDGTIWTIADIKPMVIKASEGNDTIKGYASNDTLSGLGGNDVILGNGGNDVILGGEGNDTLDGGVGDDQLFGDAGNDVLLGGDGNDALSGGAGDDRLEAGGGDDTLIGGTGNDYIDAGAGRDVLQGGDGDDILIGGAGDDSIAGGKGNDVLDGGNGKNSYFFAKGDGQDVISDAYESDEITIYVSDLSLDTLVFRRAGRNLQISFLDSLSDQLTLKNFFNSELPYSGIRLDSGIGAYVLNPAQLKLLTLEGSVLNDLIWGFSGDDVIRTLDGDDTIYGGAGSDLIEGGSGNDRLYGDSGNDVVDKIVGAGDDIIDGGSGNDQLFGGWGNDTYWLSPGWGADQIADGVGHDTVRFSGVQPEELLLRRDGDDLVVLRAGSADTLRVINQFKDVAGSLGELHVDRFEFDGGVIWDFEAIKNMALAGTDVADTIFGFFDDDTIDAGSGNDTVKSGAGNDNLTGGKGDDQLEGGEGDDTYWFARGDDVDRVSDSAGTDTLRFSDSLPSDLVLRRDGLDLLVRRAESGDEVRVTGQFSNLAGTQGVTPIEFIQFADGTRWNYEQIKQMALAGTSVADEIFGYADSDVIHAGEGDDVVHGFDGDDEVHGQAGNDTLNGGDGNDTLFGESGDDVLNGDWGDDTLHGGEGNDVLNGGGGDDQLFGDDGADHLVGMGLLDGGSGNDLLEGSGQLLGGDGNDTLKGEGFDTLRGGAGDDLIEAYSNAWDQGSNTIEGGAGNDTLYGSFGEDTYLFNLGDGHDLLIERRADQAYSNIEPTADTLNFGAGIAASDLSFYRRGLDMHIEHANGTDSITVQNWFKEPSDHFKLEQFVFADGSQLTQAEVESRVVRQGTEGVDSFIGYRELNDTMRLGAGDDKAWGRAGADVLYGEVGNDYLDGEAGNDTLYGGDGNDQLMGGVGDDLLFGGSGDDKYVYALGGGTDVIDNTGGGYDGVFFSTGITEDRLSFSRDGNDLLISVDDDPAQSVRIKAHFAGGDKAISYVQPDGSFMINAARIAQIIAAGSVPGGFDTLVEGTTAGEQLAGGQGRDMVRGLAGNDTLFGMSGDDQLEGGDGNDYLSGGNGGQSGSGNDTLLGGAGNDVLDGEDGNDMLTGEAGDDKYYYRANGGLDVIDNTGGGFDGAFFIGIARSRLSFHRDGDDLIILVDGDLDQQVKVLKHFQGGDFALDYVQPDGGSYLTTSQIAGLLTALPSTDGGQTGGGSSGGDNGGNTGGNSGGSTGGEQPPTAGLGGADNLVGTAGNDVLLGGAGNDTLAGAAGNDVLLGGVGDDTYVYTGGQDVIQETGGAADTLRFAAGITFNQVGSGLSKSGNDLILKVNGSTANQVTLKDFFLGGDNLVETFTFETGGQLTAAQIFSAFGLSVPAPVAAFDSTVQGGAGNDAALNGTAQRDLLQGFNGNDVLDGQQGNDRLEGGNGNDTLIGGLGNDTLLGGRGDDTYVFSAGSGQDVIDNTGGGFDTLRFDGISFNQVGSGLMKSGNDLVLNVSGGTDKVTLKNWFLGGDHVVDVISFSTGGQLSAAQIFAAFGLTNPDSVGSPNYQNLPDERSFGTSLAGLAGNQNILGSSDADWLDGGAGDDTLRGNQGNDYLLGGDGNDTYRFAAGDGQDTINNLSNRAADNDVLSFEGIARESLWFSRQGDSLVIDVLGAADSVTVQDWYANSGQQLDAITTASSSLVANKVDALVNAMAAFGAPAAGEVTLSQTQRDQINAVIAANWQA